MAADDMPPLLNLIDDLTLRGRAEKTAEMMRKAMSRALGATYQFDSN